VDPGSLRAQGNPPASQDGIHTVVIDLIGIAHCFRAGHRLRLQISSGAHPRLVRNTGTGAPLATATELRPANQEIFHDPQHPSMLTLPRAIPIPTATLRLESTS
jgi:predicted acyl esterase